MADQTSGLAPRQFKRVRIAFLGHQTAAGAVTVIQPDKAEAGVGKNNQVFRQTAEMRTQQGQGEQKFRHMIPILDGLNAVRTGAPKPQPLCKTLAINGVRCPRQRA